MGILISLVNKLGAKHGLRALKFRQSTKPREVDVDYQWTGDQRFDKQREVRNKSQFENDSNQKKEEMQNRRVLHTKNLVRDLFKDNLLSRFDRDNVNKKMQDPDFLDEIYLLEQSISGSPDYRKKIARHIKNYID
jgi:hypothetical protein